MDKSNRRKHVFGMIQPKRQATMYQTSCLRVIGWLEIPFKDLRLTHGFVNGAPPSSRRHNAGVKCALTIPMHQEV